MTSDDTTAGMEDEPTPGPVDEAGGSAVGARESSGASKGTGGLGMGTLDQGATGAALETGSIPGEDDTADCEDAGPAHGGTGTSTDMGVPTISGADRAAPSVDDDA